jgi:hypothetical protein
MEADVADSTIGKVSQQLENTNARQVGIAMYVATLVLELPGVLARYLLVIGLFGLAAFLTNLSAAIIAILEGVEIESWSDLQAATAMATSGVLGAVMFILAWLNSIKGVVVGLGNLVAFGFECGYVLST